MRVSEERRTAYLEAYEDWQMKLQALHEVFLDGSRTLEGDQMKGLLNREARAKEKYDAARLALLGIPTEDVTLDLNQIVFKMLTLRGIYGREMYETWYKMTVMLQSGLDIRPAITHRFGFRDFEAAFAAARSGASGKVIMDWRAS